MRVVLALVVALAARAANACDSYSTRKVIGFSADGSVVVSRVSGERPGPGEWIRIEAHRLPSLALEQRWDIVTSKELEQRLRELGLDEWVPEKDAAIAKLRAKRWKAVEAELVGKGFVIEPNRELPSEGQGSERRFRLEVLGAELTQPKAASQGDECEHDLALRVGDKEQVVVSNALRGCEALALPWFERAYLARGGALVILVKPGACAEPAMLVVPMDKLARLKKGR